MRTVHHQCLGGCEKEANIPFVTANGYSGMVCGHCLVSSEGGLNDQQFRGGRRGDKALIEHLLQLPGLKVSKF